MLSSLVRGPRIIQIGLSMRLATANCMQANGDVRGRGASGDLCRTLSGKNTSRGTFYCFMQKTLGLQDKLNMSFGGKSPTWIIVHLLCVRELIGSAVTWLPRVWEQRPCVLLRHGLALLTGVCVEKIIKRESRVVVANGRTGGDREVPKQPAR